MEEKPRGVHKERERETYKDSVYASMSGGISSSSKSITYVGLTRLQAVSKKSRISQQTFQKVSVPDLGLLQAIDQRLIRRDDLLLLLCRQEAEDSFFGGGGA
jgi:hypothetical protein